MVLTFVAGFCGGVAWTIGFDLLRHQFDDDRRTQLLAFAESVLRIVLVAGLTLTPSWRAQSERTASP